MRTYTIDIWRDESIWTWEGVAASSDDAQEEARLGLNNDWEEEHESWSDLADDMDGTSLIEHDAIMAPRLPLSVVETLFMLSVEAIIARETDGDTNAALMASYQADIEAARLAIAKEA